IFFYVREKHRYIDDVVPARTGVLQYKSHVFENGVALLLDVIACDVAGGIERHARNLLAPADARSDSGKEQQMAYASCMRKCADRFRGSGTFEGFAHFFPLVDLGLSEPT